MRSKIWVHSSCAVARPQCVCMQSPRRRDGMPAGAVITIIVGFAWGDWTTASSAQARPEYIEKGDWDKMPGQDKAVSEVARACASALGAEG